jgi:uncharacterized protein
MSNSQLIEKIGMIKEEISRFPKIAVALSGGIDSITLTRIAGLVSNASLEVFHAISPAVPPEATERVRALSKRYDWNLIEIYSGEFNDERYLTNPVNRCFYCKQSLYTAISAISKKTSAQIFSGTNADDLLEYRPGLEAASNLDVIHPFAKWGVDKSMIRAMALELGLGELANLPSSPCLSSRIETGIPIQVSTLALIHRVESLINESLKASAVRCRIRSKSVSVELDNDSLNFLLSVDQSSVRNHLKNTIRQMVEKNHPDKVIEFAPYITGSAFIGDKHAVARL